MGLFGGGGGAAVDLASPSAIGNTTPNTGAFTTLSFAPAANATGLSSSSYSLTGSNAQSLVSLSGTWNTTGTPTAILLNITNTQSNSSSKLMDLRIGNNSVYSFGRGTFSIKAPSGIASTLAIYATATNSNSGASGPNCIDIFNESSVRTAFIRKDGLIASSQIGTVDDQTAALVDSSFAAANWPAGLNLASNVLVGWSSGTYWWNGKDTGLRRNSAGAIEVNNGTAGTFRDLIVRNFRMSAPTGVPATAGATGTEGSIRWDADYIYICTGTNTWKRVAIATW